MTNPVLVISDTHYHNFKQYATITDKGVNTRLGDILRATVEAAMALRKMGGKHIIHCGDVFHVRGSLPPSVLNPVVDMYAKLIKEGFVVHMISGNHDLETDLAARVSSSVSALEGVGVNVYHKSTLIEIEGQQWHLVPWIKSLNDLRLNIDLPMVRAGKRKVVNLVIHAPLNGVIAGIPDHGMTPKDFEGLGYARVFVGHYHNHRRFDVPGTAVFSVGALTHQNWGDTEARAGYMIVGASAVAQEETKAPKFIKVHHDQIDTVTVTDNYIKVVGGDFTPAESQDLKNELILAGALAVVVEGTSKKPAVTRAMPSRTGAAPTVETILGDYLSRTYPGDTKVLSKALDIMRSLE